MEQKENRRSSPFASSPRFSGACAAILATALLLSLFGCQTTKEADTFVKTL